MKFYLAPMEGLTGYIFRNAYETYFGGVDTYITPFIASTGLNHREKNDILPEHNKGLDVVPQILTNRTEDFLEIARKMKNYGYQCVNLNLGCPSGTVVAKNRGAGALKDQDALKRFLDEICEKSPLPISVKTRIGMESIEEWEGLQAIFASLPLKELIIHPRLQKEFYKGEIHFEIYKEAEEAFSFPICYNGEINTKEDYEKIHLQFPKTERVMIGRGILKNPWLLEEIQTGIRNNPMTDRRRFIEFHDAIVSGYEEIMDGDMNVLFKMKELWSYFAESFDEQAFPEKAKILKKIKKVKRLEEYRALSNSLLQ